MALSLMGRVHVSAVLNRRMRVLAARLSAVLPERGVILDVGCGNGIVGSLIRDAARGRSVVGLDVLARPTCAIPMKTYDGTSFPFKGKSVDAVMFVDVLHHTPDPMRLLREAARVARQYIVIKDHLCDNRWATKVLTFMDWVGNRPHGVVLPYNYWSSSQWTAAWADLGTTPDAYVTDIGLYPAFARPLFEHGLHFIARVPMAGQRDL